MVAKPPDRQSPSAPIAVELAIDRLITRIDALVSAQVDEILRHSKLRKLEASWRGLLHLVEVADAVAGVKIRLLSVTWLEICRDLERASRFDYSSLFQRIYEEEFGVAGGEPFGLLLGDYEVSHLGRQTSSIDDVKALEVLSEVASAAFAPFVTAARPELLGIELFAALRPVAAARSSGAYGLVAPALLSRMRTDPAYERWRSLREREELRFIGLVLPHYLVRGPERPARPRERFRGRLSREAPDADDYLWGSAIYAFGAVVIDAFGRSGWFTDIRGARRGEPGSGVVPGLLAAQFQTDLPSIAEIPPIETQIDYAQAAGFDELGLIPLLRANGTADLLFDSNCSLYSPKTAWSPLARSSARLQTMLQYILCVSRIAHYLKVLARDQIGAQATAATCQESLQRWIRQYTTSDEEASPAMLARSPLREAQLQVTDRPGHPGTFICVAKLKPHFQLDQIVSTYEIVTDVTALSAG